MTPALQPTFDAAWENRADLSPGLVRALVSLSPDFRRHYSLGAGIVSGLDAETALRAALRRYRTALRTAEGHNPDLTT